MKKIILLLLLLLPLIAVPILASESWSAEEPNKVTVASSDTAWGRLIADYVCDGIGDQVEIQTALNSLAPEGGILELLPGDYYKSSAGPITIPSNIYLLMERATIHQADVPDFEYEMVFSNADFEGEGNDNITIEGGLIQGTSYMALNFREVRTLRLEDIELNGIGKEFSVYGVGIKIWSGEDIIVRGCYFHDGRTGLYLSGVTRGVIENNLFRDQSYIGTEISIEDAGHGIVGNTLITVTGNVFDNCTSALVNLWSSHISITGNVFKDNSFRNIQIVTNFGADNANYNSIVGNIISGGGGYGIQLIHSNHNIIANNIIEGIMSRRAGIQLEIADYNIISGNNLHYLGGHGIGIGGNNNLVVGNIIESIGLNYLGHYSGIAVTGKDIMVDSNLIRNEAGYAAAGIRVRSGSEGVIVRDNDLRDSGNYYTIRDDGASTILIDNIPKKT